MDRREQLLEQVTDHVLAHGLIGLTLRPLAAAVGTSDRMLIYHFGDRDALVSSAVDRSIDRAVVEVDAIPAAPDVRSAVNALWAAYRRAPLGGCLDVYCQAAATGLFGAEPFRSIARAGNQRWADALGRFLARSGAPPAATPRIVTLVDSALYGFHLDLSTDRPDELAQGIDDLAVAAQRLSGSTPPDGAGPRRPARS